MWKRLLIVFIMLMGVYSLHTVINDMNLFAASNDLSGGSLTVKLGEQGQYPNGTYGSMTKGDKVYVGMNTAEGTPMSFMLFVKETYNTYKPQVDGNGNYSLDTSVPNVTGWFAMANEPYMNDFQFFSVYPTDLVSFNIGLDAYYMPANFLTSNSACNIGSVLKAINDVIPFKTRQLLLSRNLDFLQKIYNKGQTNLPKKYLYGENLHYALLNSNSFYVADDFTLSSSTGTGLITAPAGGYHLSAKDLSFSKIYVTTSLTSPQSAPNKMSVNHYTTAGTINSLIYTPSDIASKHEVLRLSASLDMSNVVFASGIGSDSSKIAKVKNTSPVLGNYSNIYTATAEYDKLKLRMLDTSGNHSITLNDIKDECGDSASTIINDSSIYIEADAKANSGNDEVNMVSALLFKNNELTYYIPIEAAKGNGTYALDLTDIEAGDYKIALVNESYNENDMAPADCSALTDFMDLTIAKSSSDLTFTAKTDLEVNKNVNVGDRVGTISSSNGTGNPIYTIVEDSAYPGEYTNVKLSSDNKTVVVEGNSLSAGTYHFKVQVKDSLCDTTPADEITASITVAKTALTVAFDDPNQTKKAIADAATAWNETATVTPDLGAKITYSISGGDIGLIDIDENTGEITYIGSGAFGKVTIKATADDDPSTGNDNYNSSYAEKEIIIYREVDGTLTPHAASSDINVPTFSMDQANIKVNGTIGTVKGIQGTPDSIGGSTTTYRYEIKAGGNGSYFKVNANSGVITSNANLAVGSYKFTVSVSDKWSSKDIEVTVNVGMAGAENLQFYETSAAVNMITSKSVKVTDTNVTVYATVKGSSNNNPVTYKIKDGSTNVIEVNQNSGAITIHGVGTVTIVAEKKGATGQADASAELTFTVTAGEQEFIYTDVAGNELPKQADKYKAYEEVYGKDKTFQLYTAGNPTGSTVTYKLKSGSPTDVISVDSDGLVHILNASLNTQMGKVIVEATSHDPSGNYADKTIELPINIKKAEQTISFADVTYVTNGKGKVTPVINEQDISSNDGGVQVNDTDYYITVDTSVNTSTAWTNDGVEIEYDYDGENGIDIPLHLEKQGNRNYNKAEADGILHIMGPDENMLAVSSPGKISYGHHFTIRSLQDDSSSTNVQYTFEVDKTTYISNPTVNGNKAEFDALKYSGTTTIKIKVTRTADGEAPLSKTITVQVLPKPIEIIIDDKEKLKGEPNPTLTYQDFKDQLVSWNGVQDVIQENDIKLNTTAKTDSNAGAYPIKGDANSLNKTYPNYSFSFKEGTLTIIEENIEDDWYHLELDDGNNTVYTGEWTNQDVNIISDHNEYINMSLDQSTWKPTKVTISIEGETNQSFWMKKDSGAITKEKQELIRIDKTAPKVKNIKAKDTNNKLQDIINQLSGGIFFKPGTSFEVTTTDEKDDFKVSGTKEISYKVYKTEKQSRAGDELIKDGILTVTNEKASITISELTGTYKVCVTPTDHAGNTNTESCHEVALKKIDVDVDGDGKPDFNDPDGDGCPDLNIKWKDPNNPDKWIVINGDRDYDGIPDLNIDSDGDGKPDLNIDTDGDGKPDLNLVILKKTDWKPTNCVPVDIDNGILEEYCTGTSVKPKINVDTDGDNIPNINVDNNGDMKADVNIDTDNDLKADINIADIHKWEPIHEYKSGITYDSIGVEQEEYKPKLNIDTDGDGRPDLNIDLDGDGQPDINIDLDGDLIPDIDIDSNGDGKPDVNVDIDGNGTPDENIKEITEWKPNKNVDGDIPYDTMSFDETEEPTVPDEPDTSVKGQYNPVTSIGGAVTGDSTQAPFLTASLLLSTSILLLFILKKENHY